ncbi:hypothetical protein [Streptomyces nigra]|uniref:hypothetical protein n=1 Tax=Streptomyces nigra TaxID=1827580 RepID=UPI0036969FB0
MSGAPQKATPATEPRAQQPHPEGAAPTSPTATTATAKPGQQPQPTKTPAPPTAKKPKPAKATPTPTPLPQEPTGLIGDSPGGDDEPPTPTRLFTPRGRHRRRPHRKALLAAGGIALAAGVLSLVRLAPETGIPGLGPAEPADVPELAIDADDPGTGQDRSTRAAATLAPSDRAHPSPSATSAMGGQGTTPAGGSILVPTPSATAAQPEAPGSTGDAPAPVHPPHIPPGTGSGTTEPSRPAPTTPAQPPPAPRPSASQTPAPQPSEPDDHGICVPVIGLCVDLFGSPNRG